MKSKPMEIPKQYVWEAWKRVKKAGGSAGIDNIAIEKYEENIKGNLYKLWNRMSSGTYFPKPVKRVQIPKGDGKTRVLGIPTVESRVAETAIKLYLEPKLEPHFTDSSYGYRPNKSAIAAVRQCRDNCFKYDWVIDLDLASFFDTIPHNLLMKAVRKHCKEPWVLLYSKRIFEGASKAPGVGISQGGPLSPLAANLFLHYAFDLWKERTINNSPYERFADDICIHARTKRSARYILDLVTKRLESVGLKVNREKTKLVRCPKQGHTFDPEHRQNKFTFLGYDFKPRSTLSAKTGRRILTFTPGVGTKATTKLNDKFKGMKLHKRVDLNLDELAQLINPVVRGWTEYFKHFRPSAMSVGLGLVEFRIQRWMQRKYKVGRRKAARMYHRIVNNNPKLFYHKQLPITPKVHW